MNITPVNNTNCNQNFKGLLRIYNTKTKECFCKGTVPKQDKFLTDLFKKYRSELKQVPCSGSNKYLCTITNDNLLKYIQDFFKYINNVRNFPETKLAMRLSEPSKYDKAYATYYNESKSGYSFYKINVDNDFVIKHSFNEIKP